MSVLKGILAAIFAGCCVVVVVTVGAISAIVLALFTGFMMVCGACLVVASALWLILIGLWSSITEQRNKT